MNFQTICYLDTFELAASLRTRMGLFEAGEPSVLTVRKALLQKWPEMRVMLSSIKRLGDGIGGIDFSSVTLELFPPGLRLPWAIEEYDEQITRSHLAIRANPLAMTYVGAQSAMLPVGMLTVINSRGIHVSSANHGQGNWVRLVLDTRNAVKPR